MSGTVQRDNTTGPNRYPAVFRAAAEATAAAGLARGRILSFGCSRGEEPRTLADLYFPEAERVLGVDIHAPSLAEAERLHGGHPRLRFRPSSPATLAAEGPFAAIFAMSVLCRWPDAQGRETLDGLYDFARFAGDVAMLDAALAPGGVLAIVNAHYELLQAPVGAGYDLVAVPRMPSTGKVSRFDPDGRATRAGWPLTACVYRKHPADAPDGAGQVLRVMDSQLRLLCTLPRRMALAPADKA